MSYIDKRYFGSLLQTQDPLKIVYEKEIFYWSSIERGPISGIPKTRDFLQLFYRLEIFQKSFIGEGLLWPFVGMEIFVGLI